MDISIILNIIFGAFGLYEWWKRRKLEAINRQNTWSLYRDASVIYGGLHRLQQKIQDNKDSSYDLGRLTGQAEDLMNNQIRQINVNEKVTLEKIDKWLKAGRICDQSHRDVFNKFAEK